MALSTKDIYTKIVEDFKLTLTQGGNPFIPVGEPQNATTLRKYTGFNRWHLSSIIKEKGYDSSRFATYKQIAALGGQVKKGEKSYPLFFWGSMYFYSGDIAVSANSEEDALKKAQRKKKSITQRDFLRKTMFIKHFSVFNLSQADGIQLDDERNEEQKISTLIESCDVKVKTASYVMYDGDEDELHLPASLEAEDYSLVLQSLIGATSHGSRLNREMEFAEEELVSTIGASFIAASCKVEDISFDSKMIEHWLTLLNKNPMFLYKASSQAQKATDYLIEKAKTVSFKAA